MTLQLHHHPISSYCWKAQIALEELGTPFETVVVNLGDAETQTEYRQISPFGKIPALSDSARGQDVFEVSIIVDYVELHYPGRARLTPADPAAALEVRLMDRVFDLYVHMVFQSVIRDRLRPEGGRDPFGVEQAREQLRQSYDFLDGRLAGRAWAAGSDFTLADCSAAPALFYADLIEPIGEGRPTLGAYLAKLMQRPSVSHAIEGAKPFLRYFPALPEERARLAAMGLG